MKTKLLTLFLAFVLVGCGSEYAPESNYTSQVETAFNHKIGIVYGSDIEICDRVSVDLNEYDLVTETYLYDDDGNIYVDVCGWPIVFEVYRDKPQEEAQEETTEEVVEDYVETDW